MSLTKEQWEKLQYEEKLYSEERFQNKDEMKNEEYVENKLKQYDINYSSRLNRFSEEKVHSSPFDKLTQKIDELTTQVNNNNILINQLDTHVYFLTDLLNGLITSLINGEKIQDLKEYPDLDNLIEHYEKYEQNRNHWD